MHPVARYEVDSAVGRRVQPARARRHIERRERAQDVLATAFRAFVERTQDGLHRVLLTAPTVGLERCNEKPTNQ